jgi:YegS/Rv2252/BmrU family lipid kinase
MLADWKIIINPHAGNGKGLKQWPEIKEKLQKLSIEFDHFITEYPLQAIEKTQEFVREGYRKFVVVGGDGSLNEVLNGLYLQKETDTREFVLANIPVGNGNDWGKCFQNPETIEQSIELLKNGHLFKQDVGKLSFKDREQEEVRYFLNIAGFGFDAQVVKDVLKAKEKGRSGTFIYFLTLLFDLFKSKYTQIELKADDQHMSRNVLSLACGVCRYNGGGMMILPFSEPNSGYLDITLIKNLSKWGVIRNVLRLFNGSFVKNKKVELLRARKLIIHTEKSLLMETDGEFLGKAPCEVEIIPSALNVLVKSVNFDVDPKLKKYAPGII